MSEAITELPSLRRLQEGEGGKYVLRDGRFIKISNRATYPTYVFFPSQKKSKNGLYIDKSLGKTFKTKTERREYMHIKGLREDGELPDVSESYDGSIDTDLLQRKEGIKFEVSEKTNYLLDKAFAKKKKEK